MNETPLPLMVFAMIAGRPGAVLRNTSERLQNLGNTVAFTSHASQPKAAHLSRSDGRFMISLLPTGGLPFVVINDDDHVAQFVGGREQGGFPHGAFVAFAVAHHDIDAVARFRIFAARAMPQPTGRPCPSEPVASSTPGRNRGWLFRERTAVLRERIQPGPGKKSARREHRIKGAGRVAFAENDAVAQRIGGFFAGTRATFQKRATKYQCTRARSRDAACRRRGTFR